MIAPSPMFRSTELTSNRLVLVDDGVPKQTVDLLVEAATRSALTTHVVRASQFTFSDAARLTPGDMLYRPAVSAAAIRVERFLCEPGVVSFYVDEDATFFGPSDQYALFAREGIPTVNMVRCSTRRRQSLEAIIDTLGGFPIVAKVPGGEGGVGVLRLDSRPTLFSFVDYALRSGSMLQLMEFIPHATHIRAVVVGNRVVVGYMNLIDQDDFRTSPSRQAEDYNITLSDEHTSIAVRATHAIGVEFGGVDLLLDHEGRAHVLEVNFPCYHPQAEIVASAPVSDAMVKHLLQKREQFLGVAV